MSAPQIQLQHGRSHSSTTQHSTAQHSPAHHSTAQHSTTQHIPAQHITAQHSTAQHSTAQHSTASAHYQHSTAITTLRSMHSIACTAQEAVRHLVHAPGMVPVSQAQLVPLSPQPPHRLHHIIRTRTPVQPLCMHHSFVVSLHHIVCTCTPIQPFCMHHSLNLSLQMCFPLGSGAYSPE